VQTSDKKRYRLSVALFILVGQLRAAARAAAFHAAVAGSVFDHLGSAVGAEGGVAHVVEALHGVGGVEDAAIFDP
jgi:hypothetical protein